MVQCVHSVKELREIIKPLKAQGKTVGLVPTMGALHQGHASLISTSAKENDITVVSVFVNPTQFGPSEDFDAYPRTLDSDLKVVENAGGNIVFAPSPKEMYPSEDMTWVEVTGNITKVLCGKPDQFTSVELQQSYQNCLTSYVLLVHTLVRKMLSRLKFLREW